MVARARVGPVAALVLAGALCFGASGAGTASEDSSEAMMARIEGRQAAGRRSLANLTLQEVMKRYRVPGVSVAVVQDFDIHWARGYGVADVETGRPVERDTLFQAASISKPVTAMAVMNAVSDRRLPLDADVNTFLKSWKVPRSEFTRTKPVTLRALLSHTSGASDGFGFPGYPPSQPLPTLIQILDGEPPSNVGPVLFERPPFARFKYSGGGTTIVQLALMDDGGKPFEEIMRASVLDPLGMADSSFAQPLPPGREARAARAHSAHGAAMDARWHVYPEQAAAGLWTTPSDLARFIIEMQRALRDRKGHTLTREEAREMVTPVGVGPYAIGFRLIERGKERYFTHGGSNWGFRCNLMAHVTEGHGLVIMTNSDNGRAVIEEIESRVAAAYEWDVPFASRSGHTLR